MDDEVTAVIRGQYLVHKTSPFTEEKKEDLGSIFFWFSEPEVMINGAK